MPLRPLLYPATNRVTTEVKTGKSPLWGPRLADSTKVGYTIFFKRKLISQTRTFFLLAPALPLRNFKHPPLQQLKWKNLFIRNRRWFLKTPAPLFRSHFTPQSWSQLCPGIQENTSLFCNTPHQSLRTVFYWIFEHSWDHGHDVEYDVKIGACRYQKSAANVGKVSLF